MSSYSFGYFQWVIGYLLVFFTFTLQSEEKLFCPFDERRWIIGSKHQTDDQSIIELILQNEDINQWNELFTVQQFERLFVSAKEFMTILEKTLKKTISLNEKLKFQILESDPVNIFENSFISDQKSTLSSETIHDEYNIGRVIKGNAAIYYLRYSSKNAQHFQQNKEAWIKRLKQAYLAPVAQANSKGKWLTFTPTEVYDHEQPLPYRSNK